MGKEDLELTKEKREKESYRRVLMTWNSAIKNASLYAEDHPMIEQSCQNLHGAVNELLRDKLEISIQHTDAIFVIENQLFIEESIMMYDLLSLLEEIKIDMVTFLPGITTPEIKAFVLEIHKMEKSKLTLHDRKDLSNPHIRAVFLADKNVTYDIHQSRKARFEKIHQTLHEWRQIGETVFDKLIDEQTLPLSELSNPLDKLIELIELDSPSVSIALCGAKTNLHIDHSVHSMVLSIYMGEKIGLDIANLKNLAISALLHDVGRFLLPSDFGTSHEISFGDTDFIQLHPHDGAAYLSGVKGIPPTAVRVALEHHIGYDGLGYPSLSKNHRPHPYSLIVGLADFVSWQTVTDNYYHKPVVPHRLIRSMIKRSGTQFHPFLIKLLVPFLGLYPPGTRVRLTSGEEALSIQANLENIIRPDIAIPDSDGSWRNQSLQDLILTSVGIGRITGYQDLTEYSQEFSPSTKDSE
ncbi:hypothetical protein BVX98_05960 [bacterium F11]|nr:hypothetical protein BVX98_05960 [bacterium F11]